MISRFSRSLYRTSLCLAALWVLGCGEQAEAPRLAFIQGTVISEARFDEWWPVFAAPVLDDIDPTEANVSLGRCIAEVGRRLTREAVDQPTQKPFSKARSLCAAQFRGASRETLGFLIRTAWIRREARHRRVGVTANEVDVKIERLGGNAVMSSSARRSVGQDMTDRQFRARIRRDLIVRKLADQVSGPLRRPSADDVRRFYRRHRRELSVPRTRDLRVVVTHSLALSRRARAELQAGHSWTDVVDKYTVDGSRRTGGRMSIDVRNTLTRLRQTVFVAGLGAQIGPINVAGAWWVFEVVREHPARAPSLPEVAPRIRTIILGTREQRRIDRLLAHLDRRYGPNTVCHPPYQAVECRESSR
jgi:PPIC-type PPIASE domain